MPDPLNDPGPRADCKVCAGPRLPTAFLCRWCMGRLPLATRLALWRREDNEWERFQQSRRRFLELKRHVEAKTPLELIRIF